MQTTLENRKKATKDSPINAFERKNKVENEGALGSGMKKEHENIDLRAQKMMRGKVEPYAMPIMVRVVPTMVQIAKQTTKIPQMTIPQETQLREQKQEVP